MANYFGQDQITRPLIFLVLDRKPGFLLAFYWNKDFFSAIFENNPNRPDGSGNSD
jgi:hypothetical protein